MYVSAQLKSLNIFFWNRIMEITPQVIDESAILNTGLKKMNDSPPLKGNQSGQ